MNYFDSDTAAARYARGRPYYHPIVMERIARRLGITVPLDLAVDVGCGTGLSTMALATITRRVVGVDSSAHMIAQAPVDPRITYVVSSSDALPVAERAVDLITLGSVFHWLDRPSFFAEVRRTLAPGGHVVIYDNFIYPEIRENPILEEWMRTVYTARYPSPPRDRSPFGPEEAAREGMKVIGSEEYGNEILLSPDDLIDYLVTQSNVIARVEGGEESIDDVRRWLGAELLGIYGSFTERTFRFDGPILYLERAD